MEKEKLNYNEILAERIAKYLDAAKSGNRKIAACNFTLNICFEGNVKSVSISDRVLFF